MNDHLAEQFSTSLFLKLHAELQTVDSLNTGVPMCMRTVGSTGLHLVGCLMILQPIFSHRFFNKSHMQGKAGEKCFSDRRKGSDINKAIY